MVYSTINGKSKSRRSVSSSAAWTERQRREPLQGVTAPSPADAESGLCPVWYLNESMSVPATTPSGDGGGPAAA